jgi:hypothetical protein
MLERFSTAAEFSKMARAALLMRCAEALIALSASSPITDAVGSHVDIRFTPYLTP